MGFYHLIKVFDRAFTPTLRLFSKVMGVNGYYLKALSYSDVYKSTLDEKTGENVVS